MTRSPPFKNTYEDYLKWRSVYGYTYKIEWNNVKKEIVKNGGHWTGWLQDKYKVWLQAEQKG